MSDLEPADCPKCGFHLEASVPSCPRCGVIFSKWAPEKKRVYSAEVTVSTVSIAEPFTTIGPVYAVTTNQKGVLDKAAQKLGVNVRAITDDEIVAAMLLGDSVANFQSFPIAFAVCVEQLRRQCAALGGNAVLGLRMNFDLDRSAVGLSIFTMQLYGTAVKRV